MIISIYTLAHNSNTYGCLNEEQYYLQIIFMVHHLYPYPLAEFRVTLLMIQIMWKQFDPLIPNVINVTLHCTKY